jgi:hypothetical protein
VNLLQSKSLWRQRENSVFTLFLAAMLAAYSIHLFSFTLFEGFATFANDAGSYVLLARKWSPFYEPGIAANIWPLTHFPPGFPWILAITGASKSLYASHVLVSLLLLASIALFAFMSRANLGAIRSAVLVTAVILLPGMIISTMGILSENIYLLTSLSALFLYSNIKTRHDIPPGWLLLLLFLITLTVLTRTIGLALILTIAIAPFLDKSLRPAQKTAFFLTAACSLVLWQLAGIVTPQPDGVTYGEVFGLATRTLHTPFDYLSAFWAVIQTNLIQVVSAFNHYLSLSNPNAWFFLFSLLVLILCMVALALRLSRFKPDAIYLMFYLVIVTIWPYPEEMTRFLHPVMFLLLLQPAIVFTSPAGGRQKPFTLGVTLLVAGLLFLNSLYVQASMVQLRELARASKPEIANSYHYYADPVRERGEQTATYHASLMSAMVGSAAHIPVEDVVASVKHSNFAILANRQAVALSMLVSRPQQLCNLKQKNVNAIFLSQLTTAQNNKGIALREEYDSISGDVLTLGHKSGQNLAHIIFVDNARLESELVDYNCDGYRVFD